MIQDAVILAAEGDTVFIRSGVYTETTQFVVPGAVWETHVALTTNNLTFIGEDRASVIIGPEVANFDLPSQSPKGFAAGPSGAVVRVENLSVRNCYSGINADGDIELEGLSFTGCRAGAAVRASMGLLVEQCLFKNCDRGVLIAGPSLGPVVRNSQFIDCPDAVIASNSTNAIFMKLDVSGGQEGLCFQQLTTGTIDSCQVVGTSISAVRLADAVEARIRDCMLGGGGFYTVSIDGGKHEISNSVLGLGAEHTIGLSSGAELAAHNNNIAISQPRSINCGDGSYIGDPSLKIDMENNYWALQDSAAIADAVWDINDNPVTKAVIDFMPFSMVPLDNLKESMGGIKAKFGPQQD